jgi:hypothetical protein
MNVPGQPAVLDLSRYRDVLNRQSVTYLEHEAGATRPRGSHGTT